MSQWTVTAAASWKPKLKNRLPSVCTLLQKGMFAAHQSPYRLCPASTCPQEPWTLLSLRLMEK